MIERVQYDEHRLEQCEMKSLWRQGNDGQVVKAVVQLSDG